MHPVDIVDKEVTNDIDIIFSDVTNKRVHAKQFETGAMTK